MATCTNLVTKRWPDPTYTHTHTHTHTYTHIHIHAVCDGKFHEPSAKNNVYTARKYLVLANPTLLRPPLGQINTLQVLETDAPPPFAPASMQCCTRTVYLSMAIHGHISHHFYAVLHVHCVSIHGHPLHHLYAVLHTHCVSVYGHLSHHLYAVPLMHCVSNYAHLSHHLYAVLHVHCVYIHGTVYLFISIFLFTSRCAARACRMASSTPCFSYKGPPSSPSSGPAGANTSIFHS